MPKTPGEDFPDKPKDNFPEEVQKYHTRIISYGNDSAGLLIELGQDPLSKPINIQLFEVLCVLGREVQMKFFDIYPKIVGIETTQSDLFLHKLIRLLFVEQTEGTVVMHDSTRYAVLEDIKPEDSVAVHSKAARILELMSEDELSKPFRQLGSIWERAGENKKACEYYKEAAELAEKQLATKAAKELRSRIEALRSE